MDRLFVGRKIKKLKKELNDENKVIFEKIENRLLGSVIISSIYRESVFDILNMLLEGQKRNESYKEVIGENLDNFCTEVIENSYKPNAFEKIFRLSYLFSIGISIQLILNVIFEFLIYRENIILRVINGEVPKTNIIHYVIWLIAGTLYFLTQDLVVKTRLKKTSIKLGATLLLFIVVYLQNVIEKVNLTYMIYVNYIFLTLIILLIIISYEVYKFRIKKRFKLNCNS